MSTALIDSHAHLDYEYEFGVPELLAKAKAANISHVITIAAEPTSLERVQSIASQFENIFYTSGIHPHEAHLLDDALMERLKATASGKKCVAIGELGLDYFYEHSTKTAQIAALRRQLDFSLDCGKPIVVHSRDADSDTETELHPFAEAWKKRYPDRAPGVIHCFTSSENLARATLDMGFYISFSGIITFKNADSLREIVRNIVPLERMLVETDSPYLAPVPHRGKKNMPEYTLHVAEKVAELKGVPLETIAQQTRANTIALFRLPIH